MPAITRPLRTRATGLRTAGRRGPDRPPPKGDGRPVLRLALSRGTLALELDEPCKLGPLTVTELEVALESVAFPVDLSGGVHRFRHRRGRLRSLSVEARPLELSAALAPRLRGLLSSATPELSVIPTVDGVLVGLRAGSSALAFEVLVAPLEEDLRLLIQAARGLALGAPPSIVAMRALGALLGTVAERVGGAFVIRQAAGKLAKQLLPEAGARAPSTEGLRFEALGGDLTRLWLAAAEDAVTAASSDGVLSALELSELTADADERALKGDLDGARASYVTLLERAPRHPEISSRVAWIDRVAGGRAEAALATVLDVTSAIEAGILGAELLAEVGDSDGAATAMLRAGITEPYGPLASLCLLRASELTADDATRISVIDEAIARSPAMAEARWVRLADRLARADLRGARGDAEHLEASATGRASRFEQCKRAADAFFARGFARDAQALYERALRYAPDDPPAVLGLARSLRELGQERRAIELYARAVALAERRGERALSAELELARALAEIAHDRPAAVARVRAIPADAGEAAEARLLEARWRGELGDLAGAGLAMGRLRETVERAGHVPPGEASRLAVLLLEAAEIDENVRGDVVAARRDLALALALRPHDKRIGLQFRRLAALDVADAPVAVPPPIPSGLGSPAAHAAAADAADADDANAQTDGERAEPNDEARAEELTHKLRADPSDRDVVLELAGVLWRLGHDLELLALLSARLDEADEETRAMLAPRRRDVLLRLASTARDHGRQSEADLYESMLE